MKHFTLILSLICLSFSIQSFIAFRENEKQLTPYQFKLPYYIERSFIYMNLPEDNLLTEEGIALGKRLFFDKRLSKNNTISCSSCHLQEYAFSDTNRFSKGIDGTLGDRNSMSLFNLAWSSRFFWDGRAASLREQIHQPVIDKREMANTWADVIASIEKDKNYVKQFRLVFDTTAITDELIKKAIEQYILSLTSFESRYDNYWFLDQSDALNDIEKKGLKIFMRNCTNCHSRELLTDNLFHNNGLDSVPNLGLYNATADKNDLGKMKTPSLRHVSLTAPYMHDGRFKTLEEVIEFYSSGIQTNSPNLDFHMKPFGKGLNLSEAEKNQLLAFLNVL